MKRWSLRIHGLVSLLLGCVLFAGVAVWAEDEPEKAPGTAENAATENAAAEKDSDAEKDAENAATEKDAEKGAEKDASESTDDYFEQYRVLIDTIEQIERSYVQDFSRRELIDAAIQGIFRKLDPYSDYIPRDQMDMFRKDIDSKFGGIGVQIAQEGKNVLILAPLPNSPAYRAGICSGDVILEVDGKSTAGLNIEDVSLMMKGEVGTKLSLKLSRQGIPEPLSVELEREIIAIETVNGFDRNADDSWNYWLDKRNGIAYVAISSFGQDTANELRQVLETIQKPAEEGGESPLKGLILDVRFNPGGILPVAVEICDMFLSDGRIVSIRGRNVDEQVWDAKPEMLVPANVPMVVLLNHYSASASEIVAACLQDHHRAVLVGERSWGKGSVQNVLDLDDGNSALKLTTAGYFRPNGKNIHRAENATESDEWGVSPTDDKLVSMTLAQETRLIEDMHRRQELRTHKAVEPTMGRPQPPFEDPQLRKALGVLEQKLKTRANATQVLRKRLQQKPR